ncbi:MAG: endonuclease/exonuclease/phosphatase family protein [Prevotellaceae bacterium]|nr:endonuclease/exonuclease/phosphatase family protein [Prevotellaceae bacterium]
MAALRLSLPLLICCLALTPLPLEAQRRLRVMEWNVENLFDTEHDSLKNDLEFLPEGVRQWTPTRYWRKQRDVARVIMAVGGDRPPDLVALCEVENDRCLSDLTRRSPLRSLRYRYVMTDSPDLRGIDVALLYQPESFRLIDYEAKRVPSLEAGLNPTRDILHAWGLTTGGDTLHVVVCHFPSRTQGRKGDKNRLLAARTLRLLLDSLGGERKLLVLGDFNAAPRDRVFRELGGVVTDLAPRARRPAEGTYRFRGLWSWIDHILVSESLLGKVSSELRLYTAPWLQDWYPKSGWYPRRTYKGLYYSGGASDHVPIYCDIELGQ